MREACPTQDLAYCIYPSTSPAFRENYLDEMLQLYADEFRRLCDTVGVEYLPDFSFEALKRRFHRAKLMGALLRIMVLPIMLNDASDMENFKEDVDLSEMIKTAMSSPAAEQYKEKVYQLVKELNNEGVI